MSLNSDVFEEFAKIAMEKGLIKKAEEKESKQLKDYKNDPYPRVGSDSLSKIEALYGVKPDKPESMKYEYNIVEDAHPNQVILAPSYDKLNGLVENINERNQILINISRKPSTGLLVHKKYAESELVHALVRIANDMDNRDNDELRILADTCIAQLKKKAKSLRFPSSPGWMGGAAAALLPEGPLGWIALGAAVLGGVYLYNHINDPDNGLVANTNNAIQQINDLIGADWFHQTFYATLKPDFINQLTKLRNDLTSLQTAAQQFNTIQDQAQSLKTLDQLKQTAEASGQEIVEKTNEFKAFLQNIAPEITQAIQLLSQSNIRDIAVQDDTWFSQLTSKIEPIFHGGLGLFSDRFDDVKDALVPLQASIKDTFAKINQLDATEGQRQKSLANQAGLAHQIETPDLGQTPAQSGATTTTTPSSNEESDFQEALSAINR